MASPGPLRRESSIRRYFDELFDQDRVELVPEFRPEDDANHSLAPGRPRGGEGVVVVVQALPRAFPDLHYTIEEVAVRDGAVTVPTTVRDAHRREYFGLPGTGRAFRVSQIALERFPRRPNRRPPRVSDGQSLTRRSGAIG